MRGMTWNALTSPRFVRRVEKRKFDLKPWRIEALRWVERSWSGVGDEESLRRDF
jgi:hypothetical protein